MMISIMRAGKRMKERLVESERELKGRRESFSCVEVQETR